MRNLIFGFLVVFGFGVVLTNTGCSPADGNKTGHEFMPDMGPSIAYEANHMVYYNTNTWETKDSLMNYYLNPKLPVKGTIPRGYAGLANLTNNSDVIAKAELMAGRPMNGSVPYYYGNTEEERTRAMTEITTNPYPITVAGLAKGKELYNIYCGICHGEKADGNGYIVRDDGGKYPAQPAILTNEEFSTASEGRYYHSIMYGKNVMGGYSDKLSYEERWQVIHYIRSLQAKANGTSYDPVPETQIVEDIQLETSSTDGVPHEGTDHDATTGEGNTHDTGVNHDGGH